MGGSCCNCGAKIEEYPCKFCKWISPDPKRRGFLEDYANEKDSLAGLDFGNDKD